LCNRSITAVVSQPLESVGRERVVNQTVGGDVQQDMDTERDADAAARDLTVSRQHAVDPQSGAQEPFPPEPASHQVVVGDIPRQPPGFQPRPYLMEQLNRPGHGLSVLTGVQGAGKTQLAAAYARAKLAAGWRMVAWVNAGDRGSLVAGLAAVADAAGLSDGSEGDSADAGAAVRRWLEADGERCLLVFDDVEDPDALWPFIPDGGAARVLITGSRQSAADPGTSVAVSAFGADEALAFLVGRTGLDDQAGAAAVAAMLGHLPLALALAAPVIAGHHGGYAWYLGRLQAMPTDAYLTGEDRQPYPAGVTLPVVLSLQAVEAADPTGVCTQLMVMMAVLSTAGVRRELLHAAAQAGALAGGRRRVTVGQLDRVLGWLSDRSLLTFSLDGRTVILHRLAARVIRNGLARSDMLAACEAAAFVLDAYSRALMGSRDRRAVRAIPQQVTALLEMTAGTAAEAGDELASVLLRLRFIAFYHVLELGDSASLAIAIGEPLTADLERLLGPDHPDTLNSRNSLAAAYLAAGRVAEAIQLFEQTLAVLQRMLGPDDPETLTSQNNLASAYQDAGRSDEAIRLYELNLETRERLLGAGHPSTMNSRGNLAAAYLAAGRTADAIPLLEQTLHGRERLLGPDHPDTRTSRRNLAKAYTDAGRVAEAIPLLEQGVDVRERLLSPGHPGTRTSRKGLASSYRDGDRVAEAITPAGQISSPRRGQRLVGPAGQSIPAGEVRRPPAGPARRVLPAAFRRPPAGPARQPIADGAGRALAKPFGRMQGSPPKDLQYDRGIVAAITAGDPAGITMAYDRYAGALYGYCHWMLRDSAGAAAAVQDTFVIAVTTLSDRFEAATLRPWLFARARNECRRRIRTTPTSRGEKAGPADERSAAPQRPRAAGQPADAASPLIDATMPIRVVSESADAAGPLIDTTMPFRAVSGSADATRRLADVTMPFPRISGSTDATRGLADVTMPFRRISGSADAMYGLADVTMPFRRISGSADATRGLADVTMPFRAVSGPADATHGQAHGNGDHGQAEVRALIYSILAELRPHEREVTELSFRHDLDDNDLAIALGLSWARAHALAARVRSWLEEAFDAVHTALTKREACPVLGELLADWDGRLTEQTRNLVAWHMEQCQACANYGRGAQRAATFSRMLPLAPLPPELREQVLTRCSATAEDAVAYRRRVARRAESMWSARFSPAIRQVSWDGIRVHPGAAIATGAVALWVAAAVTVLLFVFAGSHPARAHAVQPVVSTFSSSPSAAATAAAPAATAAAPATSAAGSTSAAVTPSPTVSQSAYVPPPTVQPSSSPSQSPKASKPSKSPSPKPSKSPSPSPSASLSPSPSPSSPSSSPSPSVTT
jgi:RNA polymerase sigma factor (sigma-70 family)